MRDKLEASLKSKLDEIEKNVIEQNQKDGDCYYAEYADMNWLISRCRSLEKVYATAKKLTEGRYIGDVSKYQTLQLICEGPERAALLEALKALEGGDE